MDQLGASQMPALARSSRELAQDDLVMSTNSSSIVSKRSVERIYYPDEPHFFRFFVKKFQRRSPLINRGYHLRLHVIDVAVRNFLAKDSSKAKVVVNLGCGSDVLPWQCMTRYPDHCNGVKFVDVDFPDLMAKKCKIVQGTSELINMLTEVREGQHPSIMLQAEQYLQIGCDLRQLRSIKDAISSVITVAECEFMFVAEVSITYMETPSADAVIKWAAELGRGEFCLLEQVLPDGPHHPFAETMLKHFDKLKTPIKSVNTYPDLASQEQRFVRLGWSHVEVETLWSAWSSSRYLSCDDRRKLNSVEPFDEWEEFAIFGSHYCVVNARTGHSDGVQPPEIDASWKGRPTSQQVKSLVGEATFSENGIRAQRRFGTAMMLKNLLGDTFVANLFGLGTSSRLKSMDLFSPGSDMKDCQMPASGPPTRMCHQTLDLGDHGHLLVGGRASPSSPFKDCWLFDKGQRTWQQAQDLPLPLYRHASTRLGDSSFGLIIGGKTGASSLFSGCLLYHPEHGWIQCEVDGAGYTPVFGATLACFGRRAGVSLSPSNPRTLSFHGVLCGGLFEDGTIAQQILSWRLRLSTSDGGRAVISFAALQRPSSVEVICRFGAAFESRRDHQVVMVGGIIADRVLAEAEETLLVDFEQSGVSLLGMSAFLGVSSGGSVPRPLLVGISTMLTLENQLLVMGGGATCFSMGTFWNKGHYVINLGPGQATKEHARTVAQNEWTYQATLDLGDAGTGKQSNGLHGNTSKPILTAIPRIRLTDSSCFASVLGAARPVVIEGLSLGSCLQKWNSDYLTAQLGPTRKVTVHEAPSAKMDFNAKNFQYVSKDFETFIREAQQGSHLYLRALSEHEPAGRPANVAIDFPELSNDFQLPEELSFVSENTFSSVLRISGPVNMWLHYDVMANIYCQVFGSKRLVLFPPSNVSQLSFAPGASSSSIDIFTDLGTSKLQGTQPHEAILNPGDVLYLPPLWLHTASPLTALGVAVNVFFRNLESGYSSGRDVYGNRDLAAYERGRHDVARITDAFAKMQPDMREFYIRRLADEMLQNIHH